MKKFQKDKLNNTPLLQNNKKIVNFNIWEGIYSNFEMAEKYKKDD